MPSTTPSQSPCLEESTPPRLRRFSPTAARRLSVSRCSSGIRHASPASMEFPMLPRLADAALLMMSTTHGALPNTSASLITLSIRKTASSRTSFVPSWMSISPGERRFPVPFATTISSSTSFSTLRAALAPRALPLAITPSTNTTKERGRWILKRPADLAKDQTYFLFGLTQHQLAHTLFPLGHLTKPEVREVARERGLTLAQKPDSQEICFVPGGDYKQFIAAYLEEQGEQVPESAGELVSSTGTVLGRHGGIANFTVGQRKGLGVASPSPLYVLDIDPASHRVTVGADAELATNTLVARQLNWISIPALTEPMRVRVKIRHRHEPAWAILTTSGADEVVASFDDPQRAVTPGQAAVFYDGNEVVGGGWIV